MPFGPQIQSSDMCGHGIVAVHQPSKLTTRVRIPVPALISKHPQTAARYDPKRRS